MRNLLLISVLIGFSACSYGGGAVDQSTTADVPKYATEAQRARAENYWLPQNQLSPDAGVEHPTSDAVTALNGS